MIDGIEGAEMTIETSEMTATVGHQGVNVVIVRMGPASEYPTQAGSQHHEQAAIGIETVVGVVRVREAGMLRLLESVVVKAPRQMGVSVLMLVNGKKSRSDWIAIGIRVQRTGVQLAMKSITLSLLTTTSNSSSSLRLQTSK